MDVQTLRRLNAELRFIETEDREFSEYGRAVDFPGLPRLVDRAFDLVPIDLSANRYVASVKELEALEESAPLAEFFGGIAPQVGFVAGPNDRMNGLEYHKSPEILVALTDQALLLGRFEDLGPDFSFDSSKLVCLYVPRGRALELKPLVLHYSPCTVADSGFKSLIALPKGTNEGLPDNLGIDPTAKGERRLLFSRNKWLIVHREREALIEKGAFPGIRGKNYSIRYA
jgi:hypothetical protein